VKSKGSQTPSFSPHFESSENNWRKETGLTHLCAVKSISVGPLAHMEQLLATTDLLHLDTLGDVTQEAFLLLLDFQLLADVRQSLAYKCAYVL
jgi:hypothetical protein